MSERDDIRAEIDKSDAGRQTIYRRLRLSAVDALHPQEIAERTCLSLSRPEHEIRTSARILERPTGREGRQARDVLDIEPDTREAAAVVPRRRRPARLSDLHGLSAVDALQSKDWRGSPLRLLSHLTGTTLKGLPRAGGRICARPTGFASTGRLLQSLRAKRQPPPVAQRVGKLATATAVGCSAKSVQRCRSRPVG